MSRPLYFYFFFKYIFTLYFSCNCDLIAGLIGKVEPADDPPRKSPRKAEGAACEVLIQTGKFPKMKFEPFDTAIPINWNFNLKKKIILMFTLFLQFEREQTL